jgi:hypothetical protein
VVPAARLKSFWNDRILVEVIESAVTDEGCNHTSNGNGFDFEAAAAS